MSDEYYPPSKPVESSKKKRAPGMLMLTSSDEDEDTRYTAETKRARMIPPSSPQRGMLQARKRRLAGLYSGLNPHDRDVAATTTSAAKERESEDVESGPVEDDTRLPMPGAYPQDGSAGLAKNCKKRKRDEELESASSDVLENDGEQLPASSAGATSQTVDEPSKRAKVAHVSLDESAEQQASIVQPAENVSADEGEERADSDSGSRAIDAGAQDENGGSGETRLPEPQTEALPTMEAELLSQIAQLKKDMKAANTRATRAEKRRDDAIKEMDKARRARNEARKERDEARKERDEANEGVKRLEGVEATVQTQAAELQNLNDQLEVSKPWVADGKLCPELKKDIQTSKDERQAERELFERQVATAWNTIKQQQSQLQRKWRHRHTEVADVKTRISAVQQSNRTTFQGITKINQQLVKQLRDERAVRNRVSKQYSKLLSDKPDLLERHRRQRAEERLGYEMVALRTAQDAHARDYDELQKAKAEVEWLNHRLYTASDATSEMEANEKIESMEPLVEETQELRATVTHLRSAVRLTSSPATPHGRHASANMRTTATPVNGRVSKDLRGHAKHIQRIAKVRTASEKERLLQLICEDCQDRIANEEAYDGHTAGPMAGVKFRQSSGSSEAHSEAPAGQEDEDEVL